MLEEAPQLPSQEEKIGSTLCPTSIVEGLLHLGAGHARSILGKEPE
jgi:hypothetical protein